MYSSSARSSAESLPPWSTKRKNMPSSLEVGSVGAKLKNWKTQEVSLCVAYEADGVEISFCGFIVDVSPELFFMRNTDPWGMPQEQLRIKLRAIKTFEYYSGAEAQQTAYREFCGLISSVLVMTGERMKLAICERMRSNV